MVTFFAIKLFKHAGIMTSLLHMVLLDTAMFSFSFIRTMLVVNEFAILRMGMITTKVRYCYDCHGFMNVATIFSVCKYCH